MQYFPPKGIILSKRYFALCEREILGYSILPLFEEYEFIRCLKSNGDTFSVNHCKEWSIDKTISIMCIYDNIREFTTRSGNKMYKLNVFDEYGSIELYVYSKDYYKYCIGLIKHEPIMIQIKIENGFASLLYLKETKTIKLTGENRGWLRVDTIIKEKISSDIELNNSSSSSNDRRDIAAESFMTKMLQGLNKGKFTLIWPGYPRIDIDINYGWLRLIRNEGINIQVLESYEDKPCINLICGLETEEDYVEYEEEIKNLKL
jgi:DNA polymerase III alpha subunit